MTRELMVLGISGSPRNGNSQFLLEQAMDAAEQVNPDSVRCVEHSLRAKKIGPCLGCKRCSQLKGECTFKDDFQTLRDLWLQADVVIYSVPVYHMGIPGQLKCFIDRLGNSLFPRYRHLFNASVLPKQLKTIGVIVQGMHLSAGQEHTATQLINHALIMQCIPVTGDMWESYIGAAGWTSNDGDRQAMERQAAAGNYDASILVKSARDVGRRAVEMALLLRAGGLARLAELSKDPIYLPFVERLAPSLDTQ